MQQQNKNNFNVKLTFFFVKWGCLPNFSSLVCLENGTMHLPQRLLLCENKIAKISPISALAELEFWFNLDQSWVLKCRVFYYKKECRVLIRTQYFGPLGTTVTMSKAFEGQDDKLSYTYIENMAWINKEPWSMLQTPFK